ncbi:PREDICTED: uncharacterized protein LOC104585618 [Nelumbo nucifera]|uniref:Uncharacterized protein LOC104585618 n=1 Tax=Nelumbo nucifera TaxID=4432 RepID=A0A1U7YT68_NELNU|nr:PREDICTED: uncharacterized protein LOC104585618 [Nelumbo nucifera]
MIHALNKRETKLLAFDELNHIPIEEAISLSQLTFDEDRQYTSVRLSERRRGGGKRRATRFSTPCKSFPGITNSFLLLLSDSSLEMKFLDWYLKIAAVSALIGASMEFFMIQTGFYDKVTVLESEKRAWENSPEAQAIREALNPWGEHDRETRKNS